MKQHFKSIFCLATIAIFISSCQKDPKQLKYISQNAKMVLTISPMNIYKKAELGNEDKYSFLKSLRSSLEDEDDGTAKLYKSLLDDPRASGINFKQDFFGIVHGKNLRSSKMMLMVELNSREDFEATLKELLKDLLPAEIEKRANFSQIVVNRMKIGWNDEVACISAAIRRSAVEAVESDSELEKIFAGSTEGIEKNTAFKSYYKKHQDISIWMNSAFNQSLSNGVGLISGAASGMAMNGFFAKDSLTFMSTYINFNNGNITLKSDQYPSEALKKLYEANPFIKEELDTELLRFLPQEAFALMRMSIVPKGVVAIIESSGTMALMDRMISEMEKELELSLDDLTNTFKGDAIFSLSGMAIEKFDRVRRRRIYNERSNPVYDPELQDTLFEPDWEYKTFTDKKEELIPHMHLIANLNDKSALKKIIEEKGELQLSEAGYYELPADDFPMYICLSDAHFLFTTNKTVADAFSKGGLDNNLASNAMVSKLEGSAIYAYLNLKLNDYPDVFKNKMNENMTNGFLSGLMKVLSHYDDIEITMKGPYSSNFVINMKDKSSNSLSSILTSIDQQLNSARSF